MNSVSSTVAAEIKLAASSTQELLTPAHALFNRVVHEAIPFSVVESPTFQAFVLPSRYSLLRCTMNSKQGWPWHPRNKAKLGRLAVGFKMLDFQFSPAQFSQAEQVLSRLVTVDGSQADQPVAMALEQLRRGWGGDGTRHVLL
ncbi:hypothetical protein V8C86DRAFT_2439917 [Haematococcus lacustris]